MATLADPAAPRPDEVEAVVQRVTRAAREECAAEQLVGVDLDGCVRAAVAAYWDNPIKTFVPMLALRRVRACLRVGSCMTEEW